MCQKVRRRSLQQGQDGNHRPILQQKHPLYLAAVQAHGAHARVVVEAHDVCHLNGFSQECSGLRLLADGGAVVVVANNYTFSTEQNRKTDSNSQNERENLYQTR